MSETTITLLVAVIAAVAPVLTIFVGLFYFSRTFPITRMGAEADANMDNASAKLAKMQADQQFIENYNNIMRLLVERDETLAKRDKEIAELRSVVIELREKIEELRTDVQKLVSERDEHAKALANAQGELTAMRAYAIPEAVYKRFQEKVEKAERLPCDDCPAKMYKKMEQGE